MTVAELKKALVNIPEETEVIVRAWDWNPETHKLEYADIHRDDDGFFVKRAGFSRASSISNDQFDIVLGKGFGY
jgi:hypothetical protein